MSNKELIDIYFKANGWMQINKVESITPIIPFLLADLAYNTFNASLRRLKVEREMAQKLNEWDELNKKFFHRFWGKLDDKTTDAIIEKMDSLEEYTEHLSKIVKYKIMDAVDDIPMEHQEVLAAAQFCNILSQEAHGYWKKTYKEPIISIERKPKKTIEWTIDSKTLMLIPIYRQQMVERKVVCGWKAGHDNDYLVKVRKYSREFSDCYYKSHGGKEHVDLTKQVKLIEAVHALENKVTLWIKNENNESNSNN